MWPKGGVNMTTTQAHVFPTIVRLSLVLTGWCLFIAGVLVTGSPMMKATLLAAARVLP